MKKILSLFLLFSFLVSSKKNFAQEKDFSTVLSVTAATAVPAALATGIILLNYEAFWKYAAGVPFYVSNDPPYAMHIDKLAHFYLSDVGSKTIGEGYRIAGVSEKKFRMARRRN
jgi:uncharacterized membrane protein